MVGEQLKHCTSGKFTVQFLYRDSHERRQGREMGCRVDTQRRRLMEGTNAAGSGKDWIMDGSAGIRLIIFIIYGAIALNILLIVAVASTYGEVKKIRRILERWQQSQQAGE